MAASRGHLQAGSQVIISEFCDTRLARECRPAYRPGMNSSPGGAGRGEDV